MQTALIMKHVCLLVSSKIYVKRGDLNFGIVGFHFLDRGFPRYPSYGVCNLQLIQEYVLMSVTSASSARF